MEGLKTCDSCMPRCYVNNLLQCRFFVTYISFDRSSPRLSIVGDSSATWSFQAMQMHQISCTSNVSSVFTMSSLMALKRKQLACAVRARHLVPEPCSTAIRRDGF